MKLKVLLYKEGEHQEVIQYDLWSEELTLPLYYSPESYCPSIDLAREQINEYFEKEFGEWPPLCGKV